MEVEITVKVSELELYIWLHFLSLKYNTAEARDLQLMGAVYLSSPSKKMAFN